VLTRQEGFEGVPLQVPRNRIQRSVQVMCG